MGGSIRAYDSIVNGNSATMNGGGIAFVAGVTNSSLVNCLISGNAADSGGGIYAEGNSPQTDPVFVNCTISGNKATGAGGGVMNSSMGTMPNFQNCIIWNNQSAGSTATSGASISNEFDAMPEFSFNIVANSGGSASWDMSIGMDGGSNIDSDPQFTTPVNPSSAPFTSGDFTLSSSSSPAYNAGTNDADLDGFAPGTDTISDVETDLNGNPRILGASVDMGAYEFFQTTTGINPPAITSPLSVPAGNIGYFYVTNQQSITVSGSKAGGVFSTMPWLTNNISQTAGGTTWSTPAIDLEHSENGASKILYFKCMSNDMTTFSAYTTTVCVINYLTFPFIDITNIDTRVGNDITNYTIAGTNNEYVVGTMNWTNSLTGTNGSFQVFPQSGIWFQVSNIALNVGTNVITVNGTNVFGNMRSDSVTITRGEVGTGAPFIDITSTPQTVSYDVTSFDIGGTCNVQVAGNITWSNELNGANGNISVTSAWAITNISLAVGDNKIVVGVTNAWGVAT
ncbi:MAG: DUF5123 domain-containing protein, partial [Planctomycetes bacterium]|nr:DUF5123 domain-containing protein [Planctomycetota bacterium]